MESLENTEAEMKRILNGKYNPVGESKEIPKNDTSLEKKDTSTYREVEQKGTSIVFSFDSDGERQNRLREMLRNL